jgi:paired amphipathic helix protein Sin3a
MSSPGDVGLPLQAHMLNAGVQQVMTNGGLEKRGPVEFNHAISYVNKIKVCAPHR